MKQEKLLTISEASNILGVAKSTLRRWEEGKLRDRLLLCVSA